MRTASVLGSVLGLVSVMALAACGEKDEAAPAAEDSATGAAASASAGGGGGGGAVRVRPGLWRTVQQMPGAPAMTSEQCVSEAEAALDPAKMQPMPEGCTQATGREGGAFVLRATCPGVQGAGAMSMEMRVTPQGDTRYTTALTTRLDTPAGPQTFTLNGEGTYLGPCPAGGAAAQ
jgi:hypothetical protein